jgi:asparagine synthase (glutamine-hydrolysing)
LTKSLRQAVLDAIKSRIPKKKFGIMFSGGIDSTLIAFILKQMNQDFICYCVGLENSPDLVEAEKLAKEYNFNLKTRLISKQEAEDIIKKTVKIIGTDSMRVGVAATEYAAIELGKKDNIDYFFGGLGSEEIFAGYERHLKSKDINEECWKGLKTMYLRDLTRDVPLAEALKVELATPLLDKDVILAAMAIPGKEKIKDNVKKLPIRRLAEELGLKDNQRPKKAAQYGSRFDHYMIKLAKKNGFKTKNEYLKSLV